MTREEAVKVIENRDSIMDYCESAQLGEALEMAIKALSAEPCEDCISRQAVLDVTKRELFMGDAISEIEKLPPVTPTCSEIPNNCEDAIRRQAVEEIINDIRDCISVVGYWAILERLKKLPSVTPKQKVGHWTEKPHVYGVAYCSECNFELKIDDTNFCPNCGAKMSENPTGSESEE